ncbi:MAG: hypothetical protein ACTHLT_20090 [Devosia sp.]
MAPPLLRQSDLGPPVFFGTFTLVGVVFIVLAKSLGWPAAVVTGTPVALMVGYAIAIIGLRRLRLRDDQTGDNFYYMGFIFTLTSLAMSLLQYSTGSDVSEIVVNFGIAVASTIAGIVLRILFNLVRRDPVEVEQVARLELADASRRVRLELDDILMELAHFRRTNQQMLEEGFHEIRDEVQRAAEASTEAIGKSAEAAREQAAMWSSGGAADQVRDELGQLAATLHELNAVLQRETLRRRDGVLVRVWRTLFGTAAPRRAAPETQRPAAEPLLRRKPESEPGE